MRADLRVEITTQCIGEAQAFHIVVTILQRSIDAIGDRRINLRYRLPCETHVIVFFDDVVTGREGLQVEDADVRNANTATNCGAETIAFTTKVEKDVEHPAPHFGIAADRVEFGLGRIRKLHRTIGRETGGNPQVAGHAVEFPVLVRTFDFEAEQTGIVTDDAFAFPAIIIVDVDLDDIVLLERGVFRAEHASAQANVEPTVLSHCGQ
uniref:hypothetical protein n=1 Tax=Erythrobacter sp. EC-HK427 TaxID=2038396 RepID=UPI0018FE2078|nr:hypothetical protein [Erythrobacter sp. EC-HK427]